MGFHRALGIDPRVGVGCMLMNGLCPKCYDQGLRDGVYRQMAFGDQPPHLPTAHGFDEYYGIPYSNDMASARRGDPPLPLVQDEGD